MLLLRLPAWQELLNPSALPKVSSGAANLQEVQPARQGACLPTCAQPKYMDSKDLYTRITPCLQFKFRGAALAVQ